MSTTEEAITDNGTELGRAYVTDDEVTLVVSRTAMAGEMTFYEGDYIETPDGELLCRIESVTTYDPILERDSIRFEVRYVDEDYSEFDEDPEAALRRGAPAPMTCGPWELVFWVLGEHEVAPLNEWRPRSEKQVARREYADVHETVRSLEKGDKVLVPGHKARPFEVQQYSSMSKSAWLKTPQGTPYRIDVSGATPRLRYRGKHSEGAVEEVEVLNCE